MKSIFNSHRTYELAIFSQIGRKSTSGAQNILENLPKDSHLSPIIFYENLLSVIQHAHTIKLILGNNSKALRRS